MQDKLLWNRIKILHPGRLPFTQLLARTTAYLTRSGESLLDIHIICVRHIGCRSTPRTCPDCRQHCHEMIQLISVAIGDNEENVERWRKLTLDLSTSPIYQLDVGNRTYSLFQLLMICPMPRLKTLDIRSQRYRFTDCFDSTLITCQCMVNKA
jgi:hypothetical protein